MKTLPTGLHFIVSVVLVLVLVVLLQPGKGTHDTEARPDDPTGLGDSRSPRPPPAGCRDISSRCQQLGPMVTPGQFRCVPAAIPGLDEDRLLAVPRQEPPPAQQRPHAAGSDPSQTGPDAA